MLAVGAAAEGSVLAAEVWARLLLDWRLWAYTPPSLQTHVLRAAASLSPLWRAHLPAQPVLAYDTSMTMSMWYIN